jgi:hypothetical protein
MTKKQFDWLKNHQPFEVRYVELYDGTWVGGCHIRSASFIGEYLEVKGVSYYYVHESDRFKEKIITSKVHRKDIRKIEYYKGILINYYNTEGNSKGNSLKKLS